MNMRHIITITSKDRQPYRPPCGGDWGSGGQVRQADFNERTGQLVSSKPVTVARADLEAES
jgi:hypothetical protein